MPVTLNSTGITFSDNTTQNTAASAGAPTTTDNAITNRNSTANVTVPSNTLFAVVSMSGGGGGSSGISGNRGRAGGQAFGIIGGSAMPPSVPFAIGARGNGGFSNGNPGGTSSFGTNLLVASGGSGSGGSAGSGSGNFFMHLGNQPGGAPGSSGTPSQNIGNPGTQGNGFFALYAK